MTKREKLARALAKFSWSVEDEDFEIFFARTREGWFEQVDALLAELREPDEGMLEAIGGSPFAFPREVWRQEAVAVWQAILDAVK